jgi:signal peptidase I
MTESVNLPDKTHSAWIGVLLSFFVSGAGQFASGRRWLGIKWFIVMQLFNCSLLFVFFTGKIPGILPVIIIGIVALIVWVMMLRNSYRPLPRFNFSKWAMIVMVMIAIIIAINIGISLIVPSLVQSYEARSSSMIPAIEGSSDRGDRVMVQKFAYWKSAPKRGDVIAFSSDTIHVLGRGAYLSRIIGLPGEKVEQMGKTVYIDGKPLEEHYTQYINPESDSTHFGPYSVPPLHYFVMGDNRDNAVDSRYYGPIPATAIIGRASKICWPLRRAGMVVE